MCVLEARAQVVDCRYYQFERRAFLPQCLSTLRLIPDIGLFEFTLNLGQSLSLAFVVKDTPSTHSCVQ